MENNNSIELQLNYKRTCVEVDLVNMYITLDQLTWVVVLKNHIQTVTFFSLVNIIFNVVRAYASWKCCDIFREKRTTEVLEELRNYEIFTGRNLNQQINLKRHEICVGVLIMLHLLVLFTCFILFIDVIEGIMENDLYSE